MGRRPLGAEGLCSRLKWRTGRKPTARAVGMEVGGQWDQVQGVKKHVAWGSPSRFQGR